VIIMPQANILVVEDEPIVAKDIQLSLQRLGYGVPAMAASGEDAIRKTRESHPDLILMDIVLKGKMDGVETVKQIRQHYDVPVIYLTAYADDHTLERAKKTAPAGYMLKPYQPNELRTTIELALHRARHDRHLNEDLRKLAAMVRCMGDAVVTTDREACVTYLNPAAEALTGWTTQEATGGDLNMLIEVGSDGASESGESLALRAMAELRAITFKNMVLTNKQGMTRLIGGTGTPVLDETGTLVGSVLVFHAITDTAPRSHRDDRVQETERDMERTLRRAGGIINLCAWCKRVPDSFGGWYDLAAFITDRSGIQFNGGLCPDCMARCFPPAEGRA
jgi:PAS domain S-box-containing protein